MSSQKGSLSILVASIKHGYGSVFVIAFALVVFFMFVSECEEIGMCLKNRVHHLSTAGTRT